MEDHNQKIVNRLLDLCVIQFFKAINFGEKKKNLYFWRKDIQRLSKAGSEEFASKPFDLPMASILGPAMHSA